MFPTCMGLEMFSGNVHRCNQRAHLRPAAKATAALCSIMLGSLLGCHNSQGVESLTANAIGASCTQLSDGTNDPLARVWREHTRRERPMADINARQWSDGDSNNSSLQAIFDPSVQGSSSLPTLADVFRTKNNEREILNILDVGAGDNGWGSKVLAYEGVQSSMRRWYPWVQATTRVLGVDLFVPVTTSDARWIQTENITIDHERGLFFQTYDEESAPDEFESYQGIETAIPHAFRDGFDVIHQAWGFPRFTVSTKDTATVIKLLRDNRGWLLSYSEHHGVDAGLRYWAKDSGAKVTLMAAYASSAIDEALYPASAFTTAYKSGSDDTSNQMLLVYWIDATPAHKIESR